MATNHLYEELDEESCEESVAEQESETALLQLLILRLILRQEGPEPEQSFPQQGTEISPEMLEDKLH